MDVVLKRGEVISAEQRSAISRRYKRITRAINREFWETESETAHSFYVGSYGRGTAIDTSDIDILVELSRDVYNRYDGHKGNGQSHLLQTVKNAILDTFPRSDVRGDGQVVIICFFDGIKFEILPAFKYIDIDFWGNWTETYDYPDSNMGGNWLSTNPKSEQEAMEKRNRDSNGLLYDTCKHMRQIRDTYFSSYRLPGIVIDSFVYHSIADWHWLRDGEVSTQPSGTYEKRLYDQCRLSRFTLTAPGSDMPVRVSDYIGTLNKILNYMSRD
jgi:hypothetical protein